MTNHKVCTAAMNDWTQYYPLADANTYKGGEGCSVVVRSRKTNTGLIYVARNLYASKVSPFRLSPGEAVELNVNDLSKILVGAEVAEEIVDWIVEI